MKVALAGSSVLLVVLALPSCHPPEPEGAGFSALVEKSDYIVEGEVRRLHAATLDLIQDTSRTVVVRVDRVLYASKGFADFTGREITVALAKGHEVQAGERSTFYTRGWLFGDSLAVVEAGVAPGEAGADAEQIDKLKATEALRRRLRSAQVVAEGSIVQVDRDERRPRMRSEHDPQWTRVVLEVRSTLKGEAQGTRLVFLYPASRDVHWYRAPKPAMRQEGVFLLHRRNDLGTSELVVIDPADVQPVARLSEIQELLKSQ